MLKHSEVGILITLRPGVLQVLTRRLMGWEPHSWNVSPLSGEMLPRYCSDVPALILVQNLSPSLLKQSHLTLAGAALSPGRAGECDFLHLLLPSNTSYSFPARRKLSGFDRYGQLAAFTFADLNRMFSFVT